MMPQDVKGVVRYGITFIIQHAALSGKGFYAQEEIKNSEGLNSSRVFLQKSLCIEY